MPIYENTQYLCYFVNMFYYENYNITNKIPSP